MKIINLVQGTPEWHAHRATARNASEAPAMLGLSKYTTRSELVRQKATGIAPEPSEQMQALFARGHAAEAAARHNVEEIFGEDLYPATATSDDDYLSASFDGIVMDESDFWENKLFNQQLAAHIDEHHDLPDTHWPQVEQQCIISGASSGLFTLSADDGEVKVQFRYQSRPERRQRVLDGWKQFDEDVANYQHVEQEQKPVAAAVLDLPAVRVQVSGQLSIVNNFDAFETALRYFIGNQLIRKPETDQDFADLDAQIKTLKKAEKALDDCEAQMLAQVASVDTMKRTKDMLHKLTRDNRLMAEKLMEAEKANRRAAIIEEDKKAFAAHVAAINADIAPLSLPLIAADFAGVIKGLKSMDSAKSKVSDELARVKIEANRIGDLIRLNQRSLRELGGQYGFLFHDANQLVLKANDDLVAVIKARIAEHEAAEKAKLEAERERIRAEEEAKAAAKVLAEMEAKAAIERAEAQAKENAARAQAEAEEKAESDRQAQIREQMREQEASEGMPQGNAVTAAEAKHAADAIEQVPQEDLAQGVQQAPIQRGSAAIKPAQVQRPSYAEIINAVAAAFNVDSITASRWINEIQNLSAEVA